MDSSSTPRKEKKGLGKLWTKVKLAIRPKSKTKTRVATGATEASNTQTQPQLQSKSTQQNLQSQYTEPQSDRLLSIPPVTDTTNTQLAQPEALAQGSIPSATSDQQVVDPEPPAAPIMEADPVESSARDESEELLKTGPQQSPPHVTTSQTEKEALERRYQRAQAFFQKYDLEFEEARWEVHPKQQVERVYKAPRMRVRWTCHECKTTFGHHKICNECAHPRCKACIRYPPKKKKARSSNKVATTATTTTIAAGAEPESEPQEGVCHECQTPFTIGLEECTNCHHRICQRCLQETLSAPEQSGDLSITAT